VTPGLEIALIIVGFVVGFALGDMVFGPFSPIGSDGLPCIPLHPFPATQNPWCEHVGQALRFCLSDLVIMKDVPAPAIRGPRHPPSRHRDRVVVRDKGIFGGRNDSNFSWAPALRKAV
jgi:hypothetical protein